jgi:predicted metalloprotease with PDZ domain
VRVRLPVIDREDLNLFEFDYDLTFMVFFLNAEGKVYARYGGRDAVNADRRQSLAGLRYTMESVLAMHGKPDLDKAFAPRTAEEPRFIRNTTTGGMRGGRCFHCHQVREILNDELQRAGKWDRNMIWRYPLPENVGLELEVDRGNVVKAVKPESPAAAAGVRPGDRLQKLNGVPIHSFGDAQFALDRAPNAGTVALTWRRGDQDGRADLTLAEGWKKTDISWRPSMRHVVASARVYGRDLTAEEKTALGLSAKRLAFRQQHPVSGQAQAAGVQEGDVILGFDDQALELDVAGFVYHVRKNYLVGDQVTVNVLRDGKPLKLTMTFRR